MPKPIIPESRQFKILRAFFTVFIFCLLALSVTLCVIVFTTDDPTNVPYFIDHFGVGLTLFGVGLSAILMIILNKFNVNASDRGDKFMTLVGVVLILFAIGSVIFSYI